MRRTESSLGINVAFTKWPLMRLVSPSVGGTLTGTMTKGLIWLCDTQLTPLSLLYLLRLLLLLFLLILSAAIKGINKDQEGTLFCTNCRQQVSEKLNRLPFIYLRGWLGCVGWNCITLGCDLGWVWLLVAELHGVLHSAISSLLRWRNVQESRSQVFLSHALFRPLMPSSFVVLVQSAPQLWRLYRTKHSWVIKSHESEFNRAFQGITAGRKMWIFRFVFSFHSLFSFVMRSFIIKYIFFFLR